MFNDYARNQVDPVSSEQCCWPSCAAASGVETPLCEAHFREVGRRFIAERTLGGTAFREVTRKADEDRHDKLLAEHIELGRIATAHRAELAARSVVYYVRTGRYVKIGFTSDLKRRLTTLRLHPTAVLATEPGGRALEAQRHAEFADERIGRREDFALSLRLEEHIRELQETGPAGPAGT